MIAGSDPGALPAGLPADTEWDEDRAIGDEFDEADEVESVESGMIGKS